MDFIKKDINRRNRNGSVSNTNISNSGSSSGGVLPDRWLPAEKNEDGSYTVDLDNVFFTGNVVGQQEVVSWGGLGVDSGDNEGNSFLIIDNLDSIATDAALSANMGRYLKELIDNINPVTNWNDLVGIPPQLTLENITKWNNNSHSHSNLSVLNSLNSTLVDEWNEAYSNNHSHSNKSVLDKITQQNLDNWNEVFANWNKSFYFDEDDNLRVKLNLIGEKEVVSFCNGNEDLGENTGGLLTIVDNLNSTLTDAALSANQGRVLKELIDNIDLSNVEIDTSKFVLKSGDNVTGSLTFNNYAWVNSPQGCMVGGTGSSTYVGNSNVKTLLFAAAGLKADINGARYDILHTGNYTGVLDSRYVNAAGDTMTGALCVSTINEQSGANGLLAYHPASWTGVANTQWGLGTIESQGVIRSNNSSLIHYRHGVGNSTIWDSSNDGSGSGLDADMLDGIHASSFFYNRGAVANIESLPATSGMYNIATAGWYGGAVVFNSGGSNSGLAFYRPGGSNSMPQILIALDGTANWSNKGTILTSASGTAVAASKLATARSIWGQSFNGEGNVTGNLSLGAGNAILGLGGVDILKDYNNNNVTLCAAKGDLYLGYTNTGNLRFYSGNTNGTGTQQMILSSGGNLGIGTTSPAYKLDVNGDAILTGWIRTRGQRGWFNEDYGGGIYMTDTTYVRVSHNKSFYCAANILAGGENTCYSDRRLKENIQPLKNRGIVEPKTFIKNGKESIGFVAQEVKEIYPELVTETNTDEKYLTLNYDGYTAVLQAQIIDLMKEVKELREEVNELKEEIRNGKQ